MSDKYSKRHSSRLRQRATQQPVNVEEEDVLATHLLAAALAQIRQRRDHISHDMIRDVNLAEETAKQKMEKIDTSVSRLENNSVGALESLLKDPQYGFPTKSKPASPSKLKVAAPTEVKEEETTTDQPCFSGSAENVLTVNTSASQPNGPDTVEKAAKHEAHTMARIAELRRAGMWSSSRLPLCVEPPRNKTHWDYVLEEVKWMANDFRQERIWKRVSARKLSTTIARQAREKQAEIEKAEIRVVKDHRRSCAMIARMVKDFWLNVDKVVDHRKQVIIESKKRKALDQHLQFIVGEADKLSQVVAEGIVAETSSKTPSLQGKDDDQDDKDFSSDESDYDDETTIAKAEKQLNNVDVKGEVDALGKEADMEFDDLLDSLPPEYLASLGITVPSTSKKSAADANQEEEEEEEEDSEDSEDDEDSEDEPHNRPSSSKSVEEKETKEEESDEEPRAKRKKIVEEEDDGNGKNDDFESRDEKMRTSREKSKEEGEEEDVKMEDDDGEKEDAREAESQEKVKLDNVDFAKLKSDNSDERQQELTHIAEEALKFQPKGYTLETTQVKTGVPHMLRGTLREYQMVGLDWLVTLYDKNLNGILADEMGLGKTIQTVALLAHLACSERIWGPHLIVVPTSVILNWEMEFKKWCPALKILTYFGSVKERAEKRKGWMKDDSFHVCITSYKVITTDIRSFKMRSWQYLILDEAQNIKNWKSQRWQTLLNVRARRRLLLTGTPLQNSLMELWSLLHFLMPAIFASHDDFKDWFSNPLTGMMEGSVEFNKGLLDRLHKVLRPFILRRMKAEVEKQLPSKTEHVVKCPLSKRQRYLYDDFMSQRATRENLKSGNMMSVLNIVMQLRKCCNHPNLFTPREEQTPLVVPSIATVFPACVFDIVSDDPLQDCVKEIPQSLNLANRKAAWRTSIPKTRPHVEELLTMEPALHIPKKVPGFHFVRPMPEKSISQVSQSSRAPEMFLVVEEGNDIGGLLKERVQVTVDGDKVMVNTDGKLGAERIRVCQAVPGGSFADVDGDSNGRRTSWKGSGGLAPPPSLAIRESGATPSVSTTSIDSKRSSTSVYSHRRPVAAAHSPIRSTTVLHSQPTNRVVMNGEEKKGRNFNELMQEGALSPIPNFPIPLSPPLKRRKTERPLVTGPYQELVSRERLSILEEERRNRLEKAVMRFDEEEEPMYSWQLMSVLWRETRTTRRKGNQWRPSFWKGEWEELGEKVREECEEMTKKFVIYVDGALTESPSVLVSTSGRTSYARDTTSQIKLRASRLLSDCDPLVNSNLVAHRMQLPEVRLIEYDCGKLQILAKLLRELYIYKHRCLIFTQMSRMLDVLQAFLSHHGYQYFRLDGTTGIEQRQAMMERFNADSRVFCFILSTRSGGVGVNLTGADTVIFYDSDWNPTMDAQAQDRCHRIGQTRNVSIYRLISEKTIEENILKKAMQKRRLGEMAIDEAGFTPDFFRQKDNIRDLFDGENVEDLEVDTPVDAPSNQLELDKAMASLEDEQDVAAAKIVRSEAKADIKEFDERVGGVTVIGGGDDGELGELLGQLKPIEKYAIKFLEAEYKPEFEEEVKEAEALLHQKKQEWNRAHERAMREEEGAEGGMDPSLSSLNRDISIDEARRPRPRYTPSTLIPSRQSSRIHENIQSAKRVSHSLASSSYISDSSPSLSHSTPRRVLVRPPINPTQRAARSVLKKAVRKRGRPPKPKEPKNEDDDEDYEDEGSTADEDGVSMKRGRGRPRKNPIPSSQSQSPIPPLLSPSISLSSPSTSTSTPAPPRRMVPIVRPSLPSTRPIPFNSSPSAGSSRSSSISSSSPRITQFTQPYNRQSIAASPLTRTPLPNARQSMVNRPLSSTSSSSLRLPVRPLAHPHSHLTSPSSGGSPTSSPYRLPVRIVHPNISPSSVLRPVPSSRGSSDMGRGRGGGRGGQTTTYVSPTSSHGSRRIIVVRAPGGGGSTPSPFRGTTSNSFRGGNVQGGRGNVILVRQPQRGGGTSIHSTYHNNPNYSLMRPIQRPSLGDYDRPRISFRTSRGDSTDGDGPSTSNHHETSTHTHPNH
ncbi:ssl-1 [Pristionchus pacificus]|nr:ssl-1 [Pristionchus pacificus]